MRLIRSNIFVWCSDALLTSSINLATSLLAGFVIFAVLGYMAAIRHVTIDQLGLEGLRFIFKSSQTNSLTHSVALSILFSYFFNVLSFIRRTLRARISFRRIPGSNSYHGRINFLVHDFLFPIDHAR